MDDLLSNEKLDSGKFLKMLYSNRKLLLIAGALAFAASVAVTKFIPPKYYSVGVIFPTNTNSSRMTLENPQFGYDLDADRLMQILESEIVMDSVINMYNLIDYYELDTSKLEWEYYLDKQFVEDVTFFRSRYMSVVINAQTKDPKLSANIVNSIIDMVDGLRENIFKENTLQALNSIKEEYLAKDVEVDMLADSIFALKFQNSTASAQKLYSTLAEKQKLVVQYRNRLNKIQADNSFYDIEVQLQKVSDKLTEANAILVNEEKRYDVLKAQFGENDTAVVSSRAKIESAKASIEYWDKDLSKLQTVNKDYSRLSDELYGELLALNQLKAEYESEISKFEPTTSSMQLKQMETELEFEMERLSELKEEYEQARALHEEPFPGVYVIDRAKPNYKKASPSYSFNAIMGTLATLFFCIVFLLFRNRVRELRKATSEEA